MTTKSERIDALRGATSDFREALETLQKSSNPKDIDALRGATSDFREALETLQKSSNPKDIEHAETVLKRAGWKKGDNGEFTPPQSDHRSN